MIEALAGFDPSLNVYVLLAQQPAETQVATPTGLQALEAGRATGAIPLTEGPAGTYTLVGPNPPAWVPPGVALSVRYYQRVGGSPTAGDLLIPTDPATLTVGPTPSDPVAPNLPADPGDASVGLSARVDYPRTGELLDAPVLGRGLRQVADAVDILRADLRVSRSREALLATDSPCDPGVGVGVAVRWAAGLWQAAEPADGWTGVVIRKGASDRADVALAGRVRLRVPGEPDPAPAGRLYLGRFGALSRQPGLGGQAVGEADGRGRFLLTPGRVDPALLHRHRRVSLVCRPAGVNLQPEPGSPDPTHVIDEPNPALPGWLPADHPAFAGLAPAGAAFGYNLAADPAARAQLPFDPPDGGWAEWDRGTSATVGGTGVPAGRLRLTDDGVWWMTADYGQAPWPPELNTIAPPDELPSGQVRPMALTLWGATVPALTAGAAVTRLGAADKRVVISRPDGTPAEAGPLRIGLDLTPTFTPSKAAVTVALSGVGGSGTDYVTTPVVAGLYAGDPGVVLSGEATASGAGLPGQPTVHFGRVRVGFRPPGADDCPVEVFVLGGLAEQRTAGAVPYLALPAGRNASVACKVRVPATAPGRLVRLVVWVYLPAGGSPPPLTVTAWPAARPAAGQAAALPGTGTPVAWPSVGAVSPGGYREAATGGVAAPAGGVAVFRLERSAADGFAGEVGLLHVTAELVDPVP